MMEDDYDDDLEGEDQEIAEAMSASDDGGDNTSPNSRATSPGSSYALMVPSKKKKRGFYRDFDVSLKRRPDSDQFPSQGTDDSHQNGGNVSTSVNSGSES